MGRTQTQQKKSPKSKNSERDAIALLKDDHEKVADLLDRLEKTVKKGVQGRRELFDMLATEIRDHSYVEEEIFYPAFLDAMTKKEDTRLYFEAVEEHHLVSSVLDELDMEQTESDEFAAKAKVLKDLIEHHVEEEETQMFPRARKVLEREELIELGRRMEARKGELAAQSAEDSVEDL